MAHHEPSFIGNAGEAVAALAKPAQSAFIVRVQTPDGKGWRDFFVNNWFHRWGPDTDRKVLAHYANDDVNYTVYGYLGGTAAPLGARRQCEFV